MTQEEQGQVFDRRAKALQRARAARAWPAGAFLKEEAAQRLADRLPDINRTFPLALDLGCHGGEFAAALEGRGGIEALIQCDPCPAFAARAATRGSSVAADEEALPFAQARFDLVASVLSLHWVNDLPGALLQARRLLKPDGLFLASLLGGETLTELRIALLEAESETAGGVSPRVSPMTEVRDLGGLLQRAGFALPVVDRDVVTVDFPNAFKLMTDLRAMGETNAALGRRPTFTRRETILRAADLYQERFARRDGRIEATFEILTMTAWAPDETKQQQPLRPGSASQRLADALGSEEEPAGDAVIPPKKS